MYLGYGTGLAKLGSRAEFLASVAAASTSHPGSFGDGGFWSGAPDCGVAGEGDLPWRPYLAAGVVVVVASSSPPSSMASVAAASTSHPGSVGDGGFCAAGVVVSSAAR